MTRASDGLPNFLRAWRKRKSLTQEKLAELAGFTSGAISQFETGVANLTVPSLNALAEHLGCRPGDILSYGPDDPAPTERLRLRSALIAYGVDRTELDQVIRVIDTYASDDEKPERKLPVDQSQPASRPRKAKPSSKKARQPAS